MDPSSYEAALASMSPDAAQTLVSAPGGTLFETRIALARCLNDTLRIAHSVIDAAAVAQFATPEDLAAFRSMLRIGTSATTRAAAALADLAFEPASPSDLAAFQSQTRLDGRAG